MNIRDARIAIVHDYLTQAGGAERIVQTLHRIWPDAPIFTSVYDRLSTFTSFQTADIRTSFLQRLPFAGTARHHKKFLTLFPIAFEMLDLRDYDIVISSSSSFAKGVLTYPHTCHITYCHSPSRFVWRYREYVDESGFSQLERWLMPWVIHRLRNWDFLAAGRPDYYISNSKNVAARVKKFYRRKSAVIFPAVNTDRFNIVPDPTLHYWLCVSRLVGYKRVDLAVLAANKLGVKLKIVGTGTQSSYLKSIAGPTVEFLGRCSDYETQDLLANCIGFIFPGDEDFGIAPIEAMACGRPIVAFRSGGALETQIEGVTGIFFDEPTVESLAFAMETLPTLTLDSETIREHAISFGEKRFETELLDMVQVCLDDYQQNC